MVRVLTLFGTRPEIIKLAPVIQHLEARQDCFRTANVASAQHTDLLYPFAGLFGVRIDHDLRVMRHSQTPNHVFSRVVAALDPLLVELKPDVVLVQGDTTTATAGALAAFYRSIPVGHVEAGLRSGNRTSPFPEEVNRRLITSLATFHFAATAYNRATLLAEGVAREAIFVTGNPVVDALKTVMGRGGLPQDIEGILGATWGSKRIVLTTHRRESFGRVMAENLTVLKRFVQTHDDVSLVFPIHPNPMVRETARSILGGYSRIHLIPPLGYESFVHLLSRAWLIVSDSGGVQEEAPTLGKPVLILRENTERPEAVATGVARLVGGRPERLAEMLEEAYLDESWIAAARKVENPFGKGDSAKRIAACLWWLLGAPARRQTPFKRLGAPISRGALVSQTCN